MARPELKYKTNLSLEEMLCTISKEANKKKVETHKIINDDIVSCSSIPKNYIDLIITSPPYNLDISYGSNNDKLGYDDYTEFSKKWLKKCYHLLKDDGRLCLNIPLDTNKGGQKSIGSDITVLAQKIGYKYHSTVIWNESNISKRTAWGSWLSASAPYVIAPVEIILILYKKVWKKQDKKESTITKDEFMEWTNGLWSFNGESKKRIGHPAPFPKELPKRCIRLFSRVGDRILDPFMGSGTTLIEAINNNRNCYGVDIDKKYCNLAKERIANECNLLFNNDTTRNT